MSALRRISTRRLLAICVVTVVAAIGVTAVAMATGGGGPKPPPKPLANAVHDALTGPTLPGVSARIQFTNNLVDASSIQGTDPLLAGATGRLWASPEEGGKLRLELQSEMAGGDTQVLVSNHRFEIYDGGSETVYEGKLPEEGRDGRDTGNGSEVPGLGEIETKITEAEEHAELSGAIPSDVAGQPTYTVHVAPKHDGGLLGGAELAWDAQQRGAAARRGLLELVELARCCELEATDVSFEAVSSSVFEVEPPPGRKGRQPQSAGRRRAARSRRSGSGSTLSRRSLDFPLTRAADARGLPRRRSPQRSKSTARPRRSRPTARASAASP